MTTYKQLFRSKKNKVFGGVCGGIGEFINIDPVIIRLIWLALFFMFGVGLLVYLFSWLIIPAEKIIPFTEPIKEEPKEEKTV